MERPITQLVTDEELWEKLQSGNHAGLAGLYQRYSPSLFVYGCRLSQDRELVKDSIQDLFVELWNRRGRFSVEVCQTKPYLLGALRHKLLKAYRQHTIVATMPLSDDVEPAVESLLIQLETDAYQNQCIREAIASLSPRQREIIHLRFYQNLSHTDAATVMDMQGQSVRNLLHSAITRLRQQLQHLTHFVLLIGAALHF